MDEGEVRMAATMWALAEKRRDTVSNPFSNHQKISPKLQKGCAMKSDMKAQKNLGRVGGRYVDPSMPVWLQNVILFCLGVVAGYCWHYNAVGGCL